MVKCLPLKQFCDPKFGFPGTYFKAGHGDICPWLSKGGVVRLLELFLPSSLAGEVSDSLRAPSQKLKSRNIEKDTLCQLSLHVCTHPHTMIPYTDHIHTKINKDKNK